MASNKLCFHVSLNIELLVIQAGQGSVVLWESRSARGQAKADGAAWLLLLPDSLPAAPQLVLAGPPACLSRAQVSHKNQSPK